VDDLQAPARERAHFEALVTSRGRLYWAERTVAGVRRRTLRSRLLVEAAGLRPGDDGSVLEVGCGVGDYTHEIARATRATVIGVDVVPAAVVVAHEHAAANTRMLAANVEVLPFEDSAFDAVVGNAVLHHLRLDRAVPELVRVLKPGGRFCFAEPNMLNPQVFLERTLPWVGRALDNSPGETAFTRWRLRRHLLAYGLEAVTVRPFDFLYPLTPARLIPTIERLGRLLERTPLVSEIAGSLLITGRKRGAG
jgi:SAM-dependent methyltransferase